MAADESAERIAVLGAGPIGLEAALYGRYLGYTVDVYERGRIAENVLQWGHVRLFSPFEMNASKLGLAALAAQSPTWRPPADDALMTGRQFADQYLLPLAASDLLADCIHENTEVAAVGRAGCLKGDLVGDEQRGEQPFRLLLRDAAGAERTTEADIVIDAAGTYRNHNWLGSGGIPAIGERQAAPRIEYGLPDFTGEAGAEYAGRRVLVMGAGYSAATNVLALAELARKAPDTRITWLVRCMPADGCGPIEELAEDRLPERARITQAANELALGRERGVACLFGASVRAVAWDEATRTFTVELDGPDARTMTVDRVIANVGFQPDASVHAELQIHECYATGGPMKLAAAIAAQTSLDCLDQASSGPAALENPEPDYYILGAKSHGRNSRFLMSLGLAQIRDVFTLIGERADLDLYATMEKFSP